MSENKYTSDNTVNVFFAADDRYLPYLSVAISSLVAHANNNYFYNIRILTRNFSIESVETIKKLVLPNIKISVFDISDKIQHIREELALRLRDYYSEAIYYRLFIPTMFKSLTKAVYLDSDIVLRDDVAKLYFTDIGENLVGAVTDESVISEPIFSEYVKKHIGLDSADKYFNSGVLVMNLEAMRRYSIKEKFLHLLCKYNFKTVAPDQDYLNFLCKGMVHYLNAGWNKHAIPGRDIPTSELHLMHFNMFNKPWHYSGVPNEDLFWETAKNTPFEKALINERESYSDNAKEKDMKAAKVLLESAKSIANSKNNIPNSVSADYFKNHHIISSIISV